MNRMETTLTPADALREAKALIEDPARWTQNTEARTPSGASTVGTDDNACQWCALGAAWAVGVAEAEYLLEQAAEDMGFTPDDDSDGSYAIAGLNDTTNHDTVMEAFDRAIALAEAEAASTATAETGNPGAADEEGSADAEPRRPTTADMSDPVRDWDKRVWPKEDSAKGDEAK